MSDEEQKMLLRPLACCEERERLRALNAVLVAALQRIVEEAAAEENDRLRATIKELVAALIQIRSVCESNPNITTNFIDEVARAALAKAKGEA